MSPICVNTSSQSIPLLASSSVNSVLLQSVPDLCCCLSLSILLTWQVSYTCRFMMLQIMSCLSASAELLVGISEFLYLWLYANFQYSWWSLDSFSAPFRGLYLPNAWSQTSKSHSVGVLAFHRYHWFGVPTFFPVGCTQDSQRYPKTRKMLFWIWLRPRYKIPEFFTIAPVLTSTLTVCRRNRGDPSSLYRS